jgi:heme/copper-type cytochrome/quinol oxidase subunit 2
MTFKEPITLNLWGIEQVHDIVCFFLIWIAGFILIIFYFIFIHFTSKTTKYTFYKIHHTILYILLVIIFAEKERKKLYSKTKYAKKFTIITHYNSVVEQRKFFLETETIVHYPEIETIWTCSPVLILFIISSPSFELLYLMEDVSDAEVILKATGHQWYWSHTVLVNATSLTDFGVYDYNYQADNVTCASDKWLNYINTNIGFRKTAVFSNNIHNKFISVPYKSVWSYSQMDRWFDDELKRMPRMEFVKHKNDFYFFVNNKVHAVIFFDSISPYYNTKINMQNTHDLILTPLDDLKEGQPRLLTTEIQTQIPALITIRALITSTDVLHSWAVPSLGVKIDAVPGRINQIPIYAQRYGVFSGQCSELCGVSHGEMPIVIRIQRITDFLADLYQQNLAAQPPYTHYSSLLKHFDETPIIQPTPLMSKRAIETHMYIFKW